MRNPCEKEEVQKESVLKKCFDCMVENGIEQTSIREFSKATGMTTSSLYYWFKDKDEIVLEATEYGIRVIVDEYFDYAMEHIADVKELCEELQEISKQYQPYMKTIFQVVASPKYGTKITEVSEHTTILFDTYAKKLTSHINIPYDKVRTIVDLCISSVIDCVLWSEWEKLSRELELLMSTLFKAD